MRRRFIDEKISMYDLVSEFREATEYYRACIVLMNDLKKYKIGLKQVYLAAMAGGIPHVEESIHIRKLLDNECNSTNPFVSLNKTIDDDGYKSACAHCIIENKAKAKLRAGVTEYSGMELYHHLVADRFIGHDVGRSKKDKVSSLINDDNFELIAYDVESRYVDMINDYAKEKGTLLITLDTTGFSDVTWSICDIHGEGRDRESWSGEAIKLLAKRLDATIIR